MLGILVEKGRVAFVDLISWAWMTSWIYPWTQGCCQPFPVGLPTLIVLGVIASVVLIILLIACQEPLACSHFYHDHLLDSTAELVGCLRVVIVEFLELPSLLNPIGEMFNYFSVNNIINLGSKLYEPSIILLEVSACKF